MATIGLVAAITAVVLFGPLGLLMIGGAVWGATRSGGHTSGRAVIRALGARPLGYWEAPDLHTLVQGLASRAGLRGRPALALLPDRMLNALASGRDDDGVVAISPGLLRALDRRQLAGVMAHEISHIAAGDLRIMRVAHVLARGTQSLTTIGTIGLLLFGPGAIGGGFSTLTILAVLWAPSLATLLLLALSRSREYQADADAVALTNDAEGLAQALNVLDQHAGAAWEAAHPRRSMPAEWLRTHPTTAKRVERLRQLHLERQQLSRPDGPYRLAA
ncbi:M48 family metalloprotease [Euzebya tangerina]|uniref:M48 family metalloprotease n=1 Tax=Euzebya tangerina TaxID=591198 RepID=UPI00196AA40F|nr:M48 family metalloprotease [Euzebya tangerina]